MTGSVCADGTSRYRAAASRWLRAFAQTSVTGVIVVACFVVFMDPYDSGRFNLFGISGTEETRMEYAGASRGRDPAMDAAIVGNSHTQALDPVRLSRLSGRHFTQLSVPGTLVLEQAVVARWFIDHHANAPTTMLFDLDEFWCAAPPLREGRPFPSWLYGGTWSYLANVIGTDGLTHAGRRVSMALGFWPRSPSDHFDDPELGLVSRIENVISGSVDPRSRLENDVGAPLPGVAVLDGLLARARPDTRILLLWTPVYSAALPTPGSPAEKRWQECKQSFRDMAASRSNVTLMDWRVPGPIADVAENFWDRTHYRSKIARQIEDAVAGVLAQ